MSDHDDHRQCELVTDTPFPQGRETHWRACYARERAMQGQPCWRLRDERTGELWIINGYEGDIHMNRLDKGSHIFHDGKAVVDERGIAHLS